MLGNLGLPELILITIFLTIVGAIVATLVVITSANRRKNAGARTSPPSFCKNCASPVTPLTEICPKCGARPSAGTSYCGNCGASITALAEICVKCGARIAPLSTDNRSKTTAVLLAVFLSYWTWLYTYKRNAWKFWLNLGLNILTVGFWGLIAWIWAIVDNSTKPNEWYESY